MPDYKEQAARLAATLIKAGMTVGLGHGRTMLHLAETLAGDGSLASTLRFVSSSAETEKILAGLGLHVGPLSAEARLDLYFDGCDQFDQDLNALKSGGGIHTMEKITAAMSDGFVLVGDEGKFSPALTGQYPVVLEVVPAAITFIMHNLSLQYPGATIQLRQTETGPALTLRGNPLLELKFEQLPAPGPLNTSLKMIAGVIEHSLFYRMATKAVIAGPSEQRSCTRPIPHNHPWCFTFPPARPSNTRCLVLSWPFIAHPRTINLRCCFNFETFCLKNIIPGLPDGATLQLSPQLKILAMIAAKGYAAQTPETDLAPWNFERRAVGANDIQIEIMFCGVCHSDLHQIRNDWFPGIFPMVPGHEIVGRVIAVGDHVKNFKVGDIAGTGCMIDSCQVCDNCKADLEQYCLEGNTQTYNGMSRDGKSPTYGGYSDNIVVREEFVLKISEKADLAAVAPLLCAGITTYSPLRHWKVGKGHKLAVLGLGGLGHMAVKFGVAFGAEVTVLSTSPKKEADAKKLGAHHFVVTTDPAQVKAATGSFDFILDTVSAEHDLNMYLGMLKTDGTHICVGVPSKPSEVAAFSIIGGRKSLAGSSIGGIKETQEMLDYCAEHGIVSDIELINIKDITASYERMLKGDVRYRFVIDMATL